MHGGNQMEILKAMEHAPLPLDEVIYEPSIEELEGLKIADEMKERAYGGLEIQIGYCNGNNKKLNAVEYHRSSELDIAVDDLILDLAGHLLIDGLAAGVVQQDAVHGHELHKVAGGQGDAAHHRHPDLFPDDL